ncbi:ATPase [Bifidobacterium pseudolongum subsp. globosum]|uniref:ATPase n=1 Tax=Bifidobacterium pseudolongum subsp. globosum TaxID=1690 RepID=A0A4Q5A0S0_9BIFI|nr:GHKL domain-containing protein [Bifidobacterium pseudolongum]RYQ10579.1 ATPase [Bifidobacterium pseudolongum subsp. globosum]
MNALDWTLFALTQIPLFVAFASLPRMLRNVRRVRVVTHALFPLSQAAFIGLQMAYALDARDWPYVAALAVCSLICAGIDVLLVRHLVASEQRDMQDNRVRLLDVQTEAQRRRMREFRAETQSVHTDYARFVERLDQIDTDLRNGASEQAVERSIQSASNAFCPHTARMCENLAVDALLAMKMHDAQRRGIDVQCDVRVSHHTPLSDVELCAVFANLCDNAIHACVRIREHGGGGGSGSAWICIRARADARQCVVNVTNAYRADAADDGGPHCAEHVGFGDTTIPEHGWGLSILESIAAQHGGECTSMPCDGYWLAVFRA